MQQTLGFYFSLLLSNDKKKKFFLPKFEIGYLIRVETFHQEKFEKDKRASSLLRKLNKNKKLVSIFPQNIFLCYNWPVRVIVGAFFFYNYYIGGILQSNVITVCVGRREFVYNLIGIRSVKQSHNYCACGRVWNCVKKEKRNSLRSCCNFSLFAGGKNETKTRITALMVYHWTSHAWPTFLEGCWTFFFFPFSKNISKKYAYLLVYITHIHPLSPHLLRNICVVRSALTCF